MSERLTDLTVQTHILLAAVDDARNVRRSYAISRECDLFGWHVVTWAWGRIDSRPKYRSCAFPAEQMAIRFTRRLLARRSTARRRIGVAYRPMVQTA
ncbi:WGR domain-containing protein [Sandarakinorhabdus cyanobacteriorum]|uniref:WGR domain-containing protein n=1 Tax=Sandarakinorhabdus cyanobacteriorum TaxID=1981098 RepID=UPI0010561970